MLPRLICSVCVGCILAGTTAAAHEIRPAYFELNEVSKGRVAVTWKHPLFNGRPLPIQPVLADDPIPFGWSGATANGYAISSADVTLNGPLEGRELSMSGLPGTLVDVIVRYTFSDGRQGTRVLRPDAPSTTLDEARGSGAPVKQYLWLGVEHILFGWDHLLFVFAMLMLVQGRGRLVKAITAFTVAHSITLAMAALGVVRVPSAPVETLIALSIVLLAYEVVSTKQGTAGLTARHTWAVAFVCGLLHGFGFAGALAGIGLPESEIPLALFLFNSGVELGQLAFVAAALALYWVVNTAGVRQPAWTGPAAAHAVGGIAAFWVIQRTVEAVM